MGDPSLRVTLLSLAARFVSNNNVNLLLGGLFLHSCHAPSD